MVRHTSRKQIKSIQKYFEDTTLKKQLKKKNTNSKNQLHAVDTFKNLFIIHLRTTVVAICLTLRLIYIIINNSYT